MLPIARKDAYVIRINISTDLVTFDEFVQDSMFTETLDHRRLYFPPELLYEVFKVIRYHLTSSLLMQFSSTLTNSEGLIWPDAVWSAKRFICMLQVGCTSGFIYTHGTS